MSHSEPGVSARPGPVWTRRTIVQIVSIFAVSRGLLILVGAATVLSKGGEFNSSADWLSLFFRFDAFWYESIVERGYSVHDRTPQPGAINYAFFPLFPLAVMAVQSLSGLSTELASLLFANAAFLAALFVIYRYALLVGLSHRAAMLSLVLLSAAPQSYIYSSAYSESLFLLLLAVAMLAMRRQRYGTSGIAAGLLSAARPNGVLFMVFALAHLVRRDTLGGVLRFWQRPERFVPVVLAPAGLFAFHWYCYLTTGDAFAFVAAQREGWLKVTDWPWTNFYALYKSNWEARYLLAANLLFFAASLLLLRDRLYEEFALCLAFFILTWASATIPLSMLRFAIVLFPIYWGVARMLEHRPRLAVVTIIGFALWNGCLMWLWLNYHAVAI